MQPQPVEHLMVRRTRAMAQVLLTKRDDLIVSAGDEALGVDLIVSITRPGRTSFRQFGVILQGSIEPFDSASQAAAIMTSRLEHQPEIEAAMTPVCVFLFNMTGDLGYFGWLFEPSMTNQGPRLRRPQALSCKVLDEKTLGEIVARVNDYYDVLASTLIAS